MNPMLKVSAAVLIAAMSIVPASGVFAATAHAQPSLVMGTKTDIVPAANLKGMVGKWKSTDLATLDGAKFVKVINVRTLYTSADQKVLDSARMASFANLSKFHLAINADAGLKSWFAMNKIDVNRVIGISAQKNSPAVFIY
jgi:hypothetical protein